MLPKPVSYTRRPRYRKPSVSGIDVDDYWRRGLRILLSRSRLTNVAFVVLVTFLVFSLLLNVQLWIEAAPVDRDGTQLHDASSLVPFLPSEALGELEHLILVPGHGVWLGRDAGDVYNESFWLLENHQSGSGLATRIEAFVGHIRKGVELANSDEKSLLVFSGGATRASTATTEAISYMSLASSLNLYSPSSSLSGLNTFERTATENYALDSFQNLLFSVARFREVTGHYPSRISVVGYEMKRRRFEELLRKALRWPADTASWSYFGIDIEDDMERESAIVGERENGYTPYLHDLYGCHGSLLTKRLTRNIHRNTPPYLTSAPEMAALLSWCPGRDTYASELDFIVGGDSETYTKLFEGELPWILSSW